MFTSYLLQAKIRTELDARDGDVGGIPALIYQQIIGNRQPFDPRELPRSKDSKQAYANFPVLVASRLLES